MFGPRGVKIVETLVGSDEFVEAKIEGRLAEQRLLWEAVVLGSGPPVRMADIIAVRRSKMPSSSPHSATQPGGKVRSGARRRHDGNDGDSLLEGFPGLAEQKRWAREIANTANTYARARVDTSTPHISRSVGIVGRCPPHDLPSGFQGGQRRRDPA